MKNSKWDGTNSKASVSSVERSRQAARNTYDRLSGWYDLLAGSEESFNNRALAMLNARPGERILELGFGTGHSLVELVKHGCRVAGVDLSPGMARAARTRLRKKDMLSGVLLSLGDGARLPYPARCFDAVFTAFTLELFDTPEIPAVLQEIRRVLRAGGRLGLVSLSLPERPGAMVRIYEWFHRVLPAYVDCRPIPAAKWLSQNGYDIRQMEQRSMWGLPVDIIVGMKCDL